MPSKLGTSNLEFLCSDVSNLKDLGILQHLYKSHDRAFGSILRAGFLKPQEAVSSLAQKTYLAWNSSLMEKRYKAQKFQVSRPVNFTRHDQARSTGILCGACVAR